MPMGSTSVLAFTRCVRAGLAVAIACAPVTAALAQGTQSQKTPTSSTNQTRQTEGQRQATPGRLVVPVAGALAGSGATTVDSAAAASTVTGTFAIQRFARTTEDAVAAVGTLTLTFTDTATDASRTIITQAAMPVARSTETASSAQSSAATTPSTQACETLRLVLDGIAIAPLGVAVQIERVSVDVTAMPGVGERLQALLCEVTSQIGGTAAPADLVSTLNALLDMLG
jgi:hypothetical protein